MSFTKEELLKEKDDLEIEAHNFLILNYVSNNERDELLIAKRENSDDIEWKQIISHVKIRLRQRKLGFDCFQKMSHTMKNKFLKTGYIGDTFQYLGYKLEREIMDSQNSGQCTQLVSGISIGQNSGQCTQLVSGISIGQNSGQCTQLVSGISIGKSAGQCTQLVSGISIGQNSGYKLEREIMDS